MSCAEVSAAGRQRDALSLSAAAPPPLASPSRAPVTLRCARIAALLVAGAVALVAAPGTFARGSSSELGEAGERYAADDARGALAILDKVIGRKGRTVWVAESLYLRARILSRDLGDLQGALRDLRRLSVNFAGTEAAAFGQFVIGRTYEEAGLLADAYREYTLCSRLRGIPEEGRSVLGRNTEAHARRITPEGAGDLVRLAAGRAALLFGRLGAGEVPADMGLPPRTFVATGPVCELNIPPDPAARSASGDRSHVWHVVAPRGKSIRGIAARFEAVVDTAAAGPDSAKCYEMILQRLPTGPGVNLALRGRGTRPEELKGVLAIPGGAGAVRVTISRTGARVLRCSMRVDVLDSAPAPQEAARAPKGFVFAAQPGGTGPGGAGGADLARAGGRIFAVWHSPIPGASTPPTEDPDLYVSSSADGVTWAPPVRLPVSSAAGDREPSLAALPGGRLLLAWTSDRAGAGTSDIYTAESPDGARWSKPRRLDIDPRDLESMGPRIISGGDAVPSAALTLHRPEVSVNSKGAARLFFVAHGARFARTGNSLVAELAATGLYGVVSTEAGRWSKPVAIVSTPITPLNRFKPAPRTREREVVSPTASPAVIERTPGRSLVGWLSTCGRVFLSQRGQTGKWTHFDTRFAGAAPAQAADDIEMLGPVDDTYGVLLLRPDVAPKLLWRERTSQDGWRVEDVAAGLPPGTFTEVAAVALEGGRSWLTAWTGAGPAGPGGVCVKKIAAPPPPSRRRP